MSNEKSSDWQEKITGEWYGCPSVFDHEGNHTGFNKVNRSSVFENGMTTYYMNTDLNVQGPLRSRFEAQNFAFGVEDSDKDRIYMGPDFFGAGHPYGMLVDAHYYSPGWSSDLKTMVHILPDGKTQVYSSLLYEGPRLMAVFNGLYQMATDYDSNSETKERIDSYIAGEKLKGNTPHVLPMKKAGTWRGEFQVYDSDQVLKGINQVKVDYRPLDLRRSELQITMEGAYNFRANYIRSRENLRHDFCGPDLFGNGYAYGRALYTSLHLKGQALKLKGRDFIIDDNYTMSCCWQIAESDKPAVTIFGVLKFEEAEDMLKPTYK